MKTPTRAEQDLSEGDSPDAIVVDTNILLRVMMLEFATRATHSLFTLAGSIRAAIVIAPTQEDEFWRNAPQVWKEHVDHWKTIPADTKQSIATLDKHLSAATALGLPTTEQADAIAEIKRLKTTVEKLRMPDLSWGHFESFADDAFRLNKTAWERSSLVPDVGQINDLAWERVRRNNPPCRDGKPHSFGDCVLWEVTLWLLRAAKGPVWFATTDSDFSAVKPAQSLHPFLCREVRAIGKELRCFFESRELAKSQEARTKLLVALQKHMPSELVDSIDRFLADQSTLAPGVTWRDVSLALTELDYIEREILKLRLGIGDGFSYTQEEVGYIFKRPAIDIREIEEAALPKLGKAIRGRSSGVGRTVADTDPKRDVDESEP